MLQIATGKLFHGPVLRVNKLRGTLFSNLSRLPYQGITTKAGNLCSTNTLEERTPSLIYEVDESIEGEKLAPGLIASYGVDRHQQDFAALVTFFLQVTCHPDRELVLRLTSGQKGLATNSPPNQLLKRVFDRAVHVTSSEVDAFAGFVELLLGLEREKYLVVMQAIRTVVTSLHRMSDNLQVAYALTVAALETLAMKFDGHKTNWEDVEERKRDPIEAALKDADTALATAVKDAIAQNEHVLLRRRFKEFILATLPESFFSEDTAGAVAPVGRLDLGDGLDFAYEMRSKYVHALEELPAPLTENRGFAEMIVLLDRRMALSFQGLFRLTHSVIIEFVQRQRQVATEPYDYIYETGSVVRGQLAPSMWMRPEAIRKDLGREWFEGFLELLDESTSARSQPTMIALRPSLDSIEPLLKRHVPQDSRRGYAALLIGVTNLLPEQFQPSNPTSVLEKWGKYLDAPCPEILVLYCLTSTAPSWTIDQQEAILEEYLRKRSKKSGLRFPRRFDAAMVLELAERYRLAGQWPNAARQLDMAAENFPEFPQLRALLANGDPHSPITWNKVLLPYQDRGATSDNLG
ncbi:MAG: hypothetical protein WCK63_10215 [Betaproteobacteria bacterium]